LDWPDDLLELANGLQIDRFAVAGFSGGSPYALACAFKIPHRLMSCGIISGVGHSGRFRSFLSTWLPWVILPLAKRFFQDKERARRTLAEVAWTWTAPDRNALSSPMVREILVASLVESFRHGTKGAAYEGKLLGAREWGFRLEAITFQNIYLWHGERDKEIPVAQGQHLAESLGQSKATYFRNDGHISVIVNHQEAIVKALLSGTANKEAPC
jgi:pimeloyl-ACP methyl ester carboxylesterase